MRVTIYHNPRCSKSRSTLELLQQNNIDIDVVEYLKTPLDYRQLEDVIKLLGISPRELLRRSETEYKDLNLKDATLTDQALIQAMADHPKLMERPIVVAGGKAVLGRPPENVLKLI